MDRRLWEKIIPASVLAVGIAAAGYFVGGRYIVVETNRGSVVFVVDRFSGAVQTCDAGIEVAECAVVQSAGTYPTYDEWRQRNPQPAPADE